MSNKESGQRSDAFPEPDAENIALVAVLKALGDPIRLQIVSVLADGGFHPCSIDEYGLGLHKSTLSHHFKTLREAGITATRVMGREHAVKLRDDAIESRFPGLLSSVLAAHRGER